MNIQQVDRLPTIESQVVGIDIETTQHHKLPGDKTEKSDPYRDRIVSIQVFDGTTCWILDKNYQSVVPLLINPAIKKIAHNASFEWKFLKQHLGVEMVNVYDTMLAERMLNAGMQGVDNGLGGVLLRYCGIYTDKSIRNQFANHSGAFSSQQLDYMAKDVLYLLQIREAQAKQIGQLGMGAVLKLENSIVPVIAQMELDGISYDTSMWYEHVQWMKAKTKQLYKDMGEYLNVPKAHSLFDDEVSLYLNLDSPAQILKLLNEMGCSVTDTNEKTLESALSMMDTPVSLTDLASIGEAVSQMKSSLILKRFLGDLLEWRGWQKLLGMDYPAYINPITKRIHCSWNQLEASTGRVSSSKPNLQNVRKPTKGEPNFRSPFVPLYGMVLVGADFSQQEVGIWSDLSGDEKLRLACATSDVHSEMGTLAYGRPIKKGDPERDLIKIAVFGDMYGRGLGALSQQLGSFDKAKEFKNLLKRTFTKGYAYLESQGAQALQKGYVTTALGRRRFWEPAHDPDRQAAIRREAQNMPIQGTAADVTKLSILKFDQWAKSQGYDDGRLVLMVHDELIAQCPAELGEAVKKGIEDTMHDAFVEICPSVQGRVEAHISTCWTKD